MRALVVCALVLAVACGHHSGSAPDASPTDATVNAVCGNNKVEPGEQCDDGNSTTNLLCDSTCHFTCGNGVVDTSVGETCDTGITSGAGACPTSCDDGMACTTDVLSGSECQAACINMPITLPQDGDGCCPTGANSTTDSDCSVTCGNGVVETGETCDTAITTGTGKCPTSCNDNMACTTDALVSGGTCQAACTFTAITMPKNGDGCCPAGANANTDNDCKPVCGNGVVEGTEQCDDGNQNNNDACSNTCTINVVETAFRMSDLDLRDPHVFVNFIGCRDVTDNQLAGFAVNSALQTSITTDGNDADTLLDLSILLVFKPLVQTPNNATTPVDIHVGAACTSPMASTSCTPGTGTTAPATATIMTGGQCLAALPGTLHPYTPAITNPAQPCFVTSPVTTTINLGGIPITLHDTRLAATFVGSPAGTLTNGLLMGFISEADANNTIIPTSFPLVGGMPLSALLAGGTNACPTYSDKDTDNGVVGWWFYLNFPAAKVPWTEN